MNNMFNLEQSISDWRKQLLAAGVKNPLPLEELESHLRADINHLVASGQPEAAAFQIAIARVGSPGTVGAEFKKTSPYWSRPMLIGSSVWAALAALFLVVIMRYWADWKWSLLLSVHVFCVTMGYAAAFLAGGFGIYAVCRQWRRTASMDYQHLLNRAICFFTLISTVLASGGFVLGMVWSSQHLGTVWTNDSREIANLCAVVWLLAVTSAQWLGQLSSRNAIRCSIAGNMVVALAWIGAVALHHGYNLVSYWPLDAWLAVHLFFLGMSVTPPSQLQREAKL